MPRIASKPLSGATVSDNGSEYVAIRISALATMPGDETLLPSPYVMGEEQGVIGSEYCLTKAVETKLPDPPQSIMTLAGWEQTVPSNVKSGRISVVT
jgi:hypothetical protein